MSHARLPSAVHCFCASARLSCAPFYALPRCVFVTVPAPAGLPARAPRATSSLPFPLRTTHRAACACSSRHLRTTVRISFFAVLNLHASRTAHGTVFLHRLPHAPFAAPHRHTCAHYAARPHQTRGLRTFAAAPLPLPFFLARLAVLLLHRMRSCTVPVPHALSARPPSLPRAQQHTSSSHAIAFLSSFLLSRAGSDTNTATHAVLACVPLLHLFSPSAQFTFARGYGWNATFSRGSAHYRRRAAGSFAERFLRILVHCRVCVLLFLSWIPVCRFTFPTSCLISGSRLHTTPFSTTTAPRTLHHLHHAFLLVTLPVAHVCAGYLRYGAVWIHGRSFGWTLHASRCVRRILLPHVPRFTSYHRTPFAALRCPLVAVAGFHLTLLHLDVHVYTRLRFSRTVLVSPHRTFHYCTTLRAHTAYALHITGLRIRAVICAARTRCGPPPRTLLRFPLHTAPSSGFTGSRAHTAFLRVCLFTGSSRWFHVLFVHEQFIVVSPYFFFGSFLAFTFVHAFTTPATHFALSRAHTPSTGPTPLPFRTAHGSTTLPAGLPRSPPPLPRVPYNTPYHYHTAVCFHLHTRSPRFCPHARFATFHHTHLAGCPILPFTHGSSPFPSLPTRLLRVLCLTCRSYWFCRAAVFARTLLSRSLVYVAIPLHGLHHTFGHTFTHARTPPRRGFRIPGPLHFPVAWFCAGSHFTHVAVAVCTLRAFLRFAFRVCARTRVCTYGCTFSFWFTGLHHLSASCLCGLPRTCTYASRRTRYQFAFSVAHWVYVSRRGPLRRGLLVYVLCGTTTMPAPGFAANMRTACAPPCRLTPFPLDGCLSTLFRARFAPLDGFHARRLRLQTSHHGCLPFATVSTTAAVGLLLHGWTVSRFLDAVWFCRPYRHTFYLTAFSCTTVYTPFPSPRRFTFHWTPAYAPPPRTYTSIWFALLFAFTQVPHRWFYRAFALRFTHRHHLLVYARTVSAGSFAAHCYVFSSRALRATSLGLPGSFRFTWFATHIPVRTRVHQDCSLPPQFTTLLPPLPTRAAPVPLPAFSAHWFRILPHAAHTHRTLHYSPGRHCVCHHRAVYHCTFAAWTLRRSFGSTTWTLRTALPRFSGSFSAHTFYLFSLTFWFAHAFSFSYTPSLTLHSLYLVLFTLNTMRSFLHFVHWVWLPSTSPSTSWTCLVFASPLFYLPLFTAYTAALVPRTVPPARGSGYDGLVYTTTVYTLPFAWTLRSDFLLRCGSALPPPWVDVLHIHTRWYAYAISFLYYAVRAFRCVYGFCRTTRVTLRFGRCSADSAALDTHRSHYTGIPPRHTCLCIFLLPGLPPGFGLPRFLDAPTHALPHTAHGLPLSFLRHSVFGSATSFCSLAYTWFTTFGHAPCARTHVLPSNTRTYPHKPWLLISVTTLHAPCTYVLGSFVPVLAHLCCVHYHCSLHGLWFCALFSSASAFTTRTYASARIPHYGLRISGCGSSAGAADGVPRRFTTTRHRICLTHTATGFATTSSARATFSFTYSHVGLPLLPHTPLPHHTRLHFFGCYHLVLFVTTTARYTDAVSFSPPSHVPARTLVSRFTTGLLRTMVLLRFAAVAATALPGHAMPCCTVPSFTFSFSFCDATRTPLPFHTTALCTYAVATFRARTFCRTYNCALTPSPVRTTHRPVHLPPRLPATATPRTPHLHRYLLHFAGLPPFHAALLCAHANPAYA